MSVSKKHMANKVLRRCIINKYRNTLKTLKEVAKEQGVTMATISKIVKESIPEEERSLLKKAKYSASKMGDKNPQTGKVPHNYRGECEDGYGYLTKVVDGERQFVHRIILAEHLGIDTLPSNMVVHHIDGDTRNNEIDNLAICTNVGHSKIHSFQKVSPKERELKKMSIAEGVKYLISL